jgi:hypothetical protein
MCIVDPLVVSIALVLAYVSVAVLTLVLRFNAGLRSPRETEPLHSLP